MQSSRLYVMDIGLGASLVNETVSAAFGQTTSPWSGELIRVIGNVVKWHVDGHGV